jgi:hypothetical protein
VPEPLAQVSCLFSQSVKFAGHRALSHIAELRLRDESRLPDGWDAGAGGFPAMAMNAAFLLKDLVLLVVSIYLLKQDAVRVIHAGRSAS